MSMTIRDALTTFFTEEQGKLVAYVRRILQDAAERDAEDIVQDVMVAMFSRDEGTLSLDHIPAYIYRALRNRVIDVFRTRKENYSLDSAKQGEDVGTLLDVLHDARYDTANTVEQEEVNRALYDAIDELREDEQAVIIATEFEGHTFRTLSEAWGIPLGTLLARKARALKKVRKALEARQTFLE